MMQILVALFVGIIGFFFLAILFLCLPLGIGTIFHWFICSVRNENQMAELQRFKFFPGMILWAFGSTIISCVSLVLLVIFLIFSSMVRLLPVYQNDDSSDIREMTIKHKEEISFEIGSESYNRLSNKYERQNNDKRSND